MSRVETGLGKPIKRKLRTPQGRRSVHSLSDSGLTDHITRLFRGRKHSSLRQVSDEELQARLEAERKGKVSTDAAIQNPSRSTSATEYAIAALSIAGVIGFGAVVEKFNNHGAAQEINFGTGLVGANATITEDSFNGQKVSRKDISIPGVNMQEGHKVLFRNPLVDVQDAQIYLEFQGKLDGRLHNFYAHIDGTNAGFLSLNVADVTGTNRVGDQTIFTYKGSGGNTNQIQRRFVSVAYNQATK